MQFLSQLIFFIQNSAHFSTNKVFNRHILFLSLLFLDSFIYQQT